MIAIHDMNHDHTKQPTLRAAKVTNDPIEIAKYTADMALELRNLAKSVGLKTLQGLLEVTYYEAYAAAHPTQVPEGEAEHLRELELASKSAA
jgi:hypothetical protein